MKYGVLLTTSRPEHLTEAEVLASTVRYAKAAEEFGYASGWVLEHHFTDYGICPDTLTFAGYLLGQTERLAIGTAVTVAPLIHPVRLAESTALLDHMSHGRFHLGLGRGSFPAFEVFGVDPASTSELMRESARLMVQAWTKETTGSKEGPYQFPPVRVIPKPATQPHPPLYVAGESPATVEWAARQGLPLLTQWASRTRKRARGWTCTTSSPRWPAMIPAASSTSSWRWDTFRRSRQQAKEEIFGTLTWWGEEGERAGFNLEELRRLPNYRYHAHQIEQAALDGRGSAEDWLSAWLDNNPVGNADDCVDRLRAIQAATGVRHIVLGFEAIGNPERTLADIRRFAEDVLPKVG